MARTEKGRYLPLSPARKMVMEILHHSRKVPSLPLARTMNVGRLLAEREDMEKPCSWMAIFLRAYGLLSQKQPPLRRALLPYPWPRLYEHPCSVAALMVERPLGDEFAVLGARINAPESLSLVDLDHFLRTLREAPIEKIHSFRQWLKWGRRPGFLRRLAFHYALNFTGRIRAKRFGTFTISTLGNLGVEQIHPLSPLTTYFTFGPIQTGGDVVAKIIYDHRVMDGRMVARCLDDLEQILNEVILEEMRHTPRSSRARHKAREESIFSRGNFVEGVSPRGMNQTFAPNRADSGSGDHVDSFG
jgi:hypothetical protein